MGKYRSLYFVYGVQIDLENLCYLVNEYINNIEQEDKELFEKFINNKADAECDCPEIWREGCYHNVTEAISKYTSYGSAIGNNITIDGMDFCIGEIPHDAVDEPNNGIDYNYVIGYQLNKINNVGGVVDLIFPNQDYDEVKIDNILQNVTNNGNKSQLMIIGDDCYCCG